MENFISFKFGNQADYDSVTKVDSCLYFILDTGRIYRGNTLVGSCDLIICSNLPTFENAIDNKLYVVIDNSDAVIYIKGANSMIPLGGGKLKPGSVYDISVLDINLLDTATSKLSDSDTKLPTSGAVFAAIQSIVADTEDKIDQTKSYILNELSEYDEALVSVSVNTSEDGNTTSLSFKSKSGETKTVTLSDLFLSSAKYDPSTHLLSLYVKDESDPIDVDLSDLIPQSMDSSQIALSRNIVVTTDVGNLKKGDKISVENVSDIQKLFEQILSQDSNPEITQPSLSVVLENAGAKEVGTNVSPEFEISFSPGSYSDTADGPQSTDVVASDIQVSDSNGNKAPVYSGQFVSFIVTDDTSYQVTATCNHSDGNVPKTFLGNDYTQGQIKSGKLTAYSGKITGYRQGFLGTLTDKSASISSSLVRGLSVKTNKKVAKKQKYTLAVPKGTMRIVVAYESSVGAIASITSDEQFGSEIKDSFTLNVISVLDALGTNGINYNVYVKDLASAQASDTKYQITI